MKKLLFFPILFFSFQINVKAQSHYVDRLSAEIKKAPVDTHAVTLYNMIAKYYNDRNMPKAGPAAKKAMQLADSLDFKDGLAYATMIYGTFLGNEGNFTEERNYHRKAIAMFADLNDEEGEAKSFEYLAIA